MSLSMIVGTALWGMLMGIGFSIVAFTQRVKDVNVWSLAGYFSASVWVPAFAGILTTHGLTQQMRLDDVSNAALRSVAFFAIVILIARLATLSRRRSITWWRAIS